MAVAHATGQKETLLFFLWFLFIWIEFTLGKGYCDFGKCFLFIIIKKNYMMLYIQPYYGFQSLKCIIYIY